MAHGEGDRMKKIEIYASPEEIANTLVSMGYFNKKGAMAIVKQLFEDASLQEEERVEWIGEPIRLTKEEYHE